LTRTPGSRGVLVSAYAANVYGKIDNVGSTPTVSSTDYDFVVAAGGEKSILADDGIDIFLISTGNASLFEF
jgi:hypothetical protein